MRRYRSAAIFLGAAFCLVASQAALGPSLGAALRRSLARQAAEYRRLTVKVSPLGWLDLLRGRLRRVEILAERISFGGPRLARVEMRLEGLTFGLAPLLLQGKAVVTGLGPSRVAARVEAADLNEYRRRAYPAVPAILRINRDRVGLIGSLTVLGRTISVRTEGSLRVEDGVRLRYVPSALEVADRRVPAGWLATYGEALALEFPIVLPLPLALRRVRLEEGYAELTWTEAPELNDPGNAPQARGG